MKYLFSTLWVGKSFRKNDLSHCYEQLELNKETKELFTINLHVTEKPCYFKIEYSVSWMCSWRFGIVDF